ncbi:MAG: class E sortase [Actinobacteria bacterium]|nr:class E sortase [Actinomycetota bacterium]
MEHTLLKVGVVTMLVSLMFAAGVGAVVGLRGENAETAALSAKSQAAAEKSAEEEKRDFDPGEKLDIDDEPDEEPAPKESAREEPLPREPASKSPAREPRSESRSGSRSEPSSSSVPDWPEPTADQVASADAPRYYQPPSDADMTLTIEALGLYDVPVLSSADLEVLDRGLMHEPETSLPSDGGAQKNVFVAGHYLGYPGTASHLVFYNLDKLRRGDEMVLEDREGRVYRYRVSEVFGATPDDSWVMGQVRDRDMLTLQTCIPPIFEDRLIVRADRA